MLSGETEGNHPLWIAGHLAWAEGDVIQAVMLGRRSPAADWKGLFGIGTRALADAARYPAFDEVLAAYQQVRQGTIAALATLDDNDLDRPSVACPPEQMAFLGTPAGCFMAVAWHSVTHDGQLVESRRRSGKKALFTPMRQD